MTELKMGHHFPVKSQLSVSISFITLRFEQIICHIWSSQKGNLKIIFELRKMHNKVMLNNYSVLTKEKFKYNLLY